MAIDLTLCIVPEQVDVLFEKALEDAEYAQLMAFIPSVFQNQTFQKFDEVKRKLFVDEVNWLRKHLDGLENPVFHDTHRNSDTIDFLIQSWSVAIRYPFKFEGFRSSGNVRSDAITGAQGIPIRVIPFDKVLEITDLLEILDSESLMEFYNYDELQLSGVYKPIEPEDTDSLHTTLNRLKIFFQGAAHKESFRVLVILN